MSTELKLPAIVKLRKPIEHGGTTIDEIRMDRAPVAGDVWDIPEHQLATVGGTLTIVANVCNLPVQVLQKLDTKSGDLARVRAMIVPFMPDLEDLFDPEDSSGSNSNQAAANGDTVSQPSADTSDSGEPS